MDKVKDGLLIYESHNNLINIGDYIQSLAARQFLNSPVKYVSREKLNEYNSSKIRLIMNGWFLHEIKNWPPADSINPIFVAFHLNSSASGLLNNNKSIEYLKKNEPIGCRDRYTVDLLTKKGIKAYFTGCLTLTLGETYSSKEKTNKIYFVDPFIPNISGLSTISKLWRIVKKIHRLKVIKRIYTKKYNSTFSLTNLVNTINFFDMYTKLFSRNELENAEYITHLYNPKKFSNEYEKFDEAKRLLNNYSQASLVITSRIHCALPCLAMETPVLYTDDFDKEEISSCRLDGLLELFNKVQFKGIKLVMNDLYTEREIKNLKPIYANKEAYKKLKDDLVKILAKENYILSNNS